MPFIAIAAFIALCLGGGVTVAADQAKPGDALYSYKTEVNDNARAAYHAVKASLHLETDAGASNDMRLSGSSESQNFDDTASSTSTQNAMVRIRTDASDEANMQDDMTQGNGSVSADGSLQVNIR